MSLGRSNLAPGREGGRGQRMDARRVVEPSGGSIQCAWGAVSGNAKAAALQLR